MRHKNGSRRSRRLHRSRRSLGISLHTPLAIAAAACWCSGAHADWEVYRIQVPNLSVELLAGAGAGTIAGEMYSDTVNPHAVVFTGLTAATAVDLHPAGAMYSLIYGAGANQWVGYVKLGSGAYAGAIWNGLNQTPTLLPTPAGYASVELYATDGATQGGAAWAGGFPHARLYRGTPASVVSLDPAGSSWSAVTGVSGNIQSGYATIASTTVAGLWRGTAASWASLNPPGYAVSQGFCLSPDGSQVGGLGRPTGGSWNEAVIWNGGVASGFVNLKPPGSVEQSWVQATDGAYQVGLYSPAHNVQHAVLWHGSAADYVDLQEIAGADVTFSAAYAVWHDSTGVWVAGYAGLPPFPTGPDIAVVWHLPAACYANCDASTATPVLNVGDFTCFLQRYAAGDAYANCDASTAPPVLNVADFTCFLQKYAAGCP